MGVKYDFGGYATKVGLKCTDGRVIRKGAFKHQDGIQVPLVWQHQHNSPGNVLGHAILENREDGVYAYGKFNDSDSGKNAKILIEHGDINSLSIFANQLVQHGSDVVHGNIREVSLVLAGANPGAFIQDLDIEHSDSGDGIMYEGDAIIYTGLHLSDVEDEVEHSDSGDGERTVEDVIHSMTEEQQNAMFYVIGSMFAEAESNGDGGMKHSEKGDDEMKKNVFDGSMSGDATQTSPKTLSHAQFTTIMDDAKKVGSFKQAFLAHKQDYGIEDIDILFPDARNVTNPPDWIKRNTEWVSGVLSGVRHSPFSRIKSMAADITADEARAKGYIKGKRKKEEVFGLMKRVTTPTTIYKKQKLDRDDIIDITDMNVVAWLMGEMRMMLDEELARAILIGDGREALDEDKINEENIRPIWKDDELYAPRVRIPKGASLNEQMEAILRAMDDYEGSGSPTLYTYQGKVTDWRVQRDSIGRLMYESDAAVANAMGVDRIAKVPLLKGQIYTDSSDDKKYELIGIIINLRDYTVGADRGGQVTKFEDFDIDFNQYKYLLETRCSGCLTHPKSALIVEMETDSIGG